MSQSRKWSAVEITTNILVKFCTAWFVWDVFREWLITLTSFQVTLVFSVNSFAFGYMILQHGACLGHIDGMEKGDLMDYVYYSSVVYTTIGFGDLLPVGAIRMLSAAEGLAGLALITWSASFTFMAMQRFWPHPLEGMDTSTKNRKKG